MLKFMAGQNSVWSICGRDVLAAFDLSPFTQIYDLGGEHQQIFNKALNCHLLQTLKRKAIPMLYDGQHNRKLEREYFADLFWLKPET